MKKTVSAESSQFNEQTITPKLDLYFMTRWYLFWSLCWLSESVSPSMRNSPLLAVTLHTPSLSYLLWLLWAVLLSKQPDNLAGFGPTEPVQANHNVCVRVCVCTMSKKRARPSAHTRQSNLLSLVPNRFVLRDLDKHGRIKVAAALGTKLWMVPKSPWISQE